MFIPGAQTNIGKLQDLNQEFLKLDGYLSDEDAKFTFVRFLRQNIGMAGRFILGVNLAPHQEIIIKGWFNRSSNCCIMGRGCAKSFMVCVFVALWCIFEPGAEVTLVSANFRSARQLFSRIHRFALSRKGKLFADCVVDVKSNTDMKEMFLEGGSVIRAVPLSGEKLRGFRSTVLVVDEALLVSKDIYENILKPFLVANQNIDEQMAIQEREDILIRLGQMKEEDRTFLESSNKVVLLSSASYVFEDLYQYHYRPMRDNIEATIWTPQQKVSNGTYFVVKMGYQAIPEIFLDRAVIEDAIKSGGENNPSFRREYMAEFTDANDSYFSMQKMNECTVQMGFDPCVQLKGQKDWIYFLGIDPNASDSPSADHFAMTLLGLPPNGTKPVLVNSYTGLGNQPHHAKYLYYLLTNFDIRMIVGDNAGLRPFINDIFNDHELARGRNINLKFIENWNVGKDELTDDYYEMLNEMQNEYNLQDRRICISQVFSGTSIRRMNEYLQALFNTKGIIFGGKLQGDDEKIKSELHRCASINIDLVQPKRLMNNIRGIQSDALQGDDFENNLLEFAYYQDEMIDLTKKECSLVGPINDTASGTQTFDLPRFMKSNSPNKVRKDSYSSFMLAAWAYKIYQSVINHKREEVQSTFIPRFVA